MNGGKLFFFHPIVNDMMLLKSVLLKLLQHVRGSAENTGCLLKLLCSVIGKLTRKVCLTLERLCMFPVFSSESSDSNEIDNRQKGLFEASTIVNNWPASLCIDEGVNVWQKMFQQSSPTAYLRGVATKFTTLVSSVSLFSVVLLFIKHRVAGTQKKVFAVIENVWYDS